MNLTTEHTLETEAGWESVLTHFAQIEQQLHTLAERQNSKIQVVKHVDMGDMHSGPEEYAPETIIAESINLKELFKNFFEMGHYRFFIKSDTDKNEIEIQTSSTYSLGGCWFEQRVVCGIE